MVKVKYRRFKGMTGKMYPRFEAIFDRQVSLSEAIPRMRAECPALADLASRGLISAVFEREGQLFPLNLECFMNAQIEAF